MSDEVLRGLLEAAPDALVAVGADGRILFANERTQELFGWSRTDLIGASVELLVPVTASARHPALRAGYVQHPRPRPMGLGRNLSGRRRDGSEFAAEISLSTIHPDGGDVIVLAAVRDVTERVQLEQERHERALEAERERSHRLESLGQLAGGIAHDFNNLLGVILNCASLAERATPDRAVAHDLAQIRAAADRAAGLTRQLLAFARREVTTPEVIALGELVEDLARLLDRTLGERTRLLLHVDPEPVHVLADRRQLEQVVLNLCLNARDALPGGGDLRVRVTRVELGDDDDEVGLASGPAARLEVSDDGVGMDPDVVARAFEPFFTTKPAGEGTGLGLSTVHGAVHQNGGRIQLHSTPGQGTTVVVHLPAVPGGSVVAPATVEPIAGGHERILVVEDEDRLRHVVVRMLAAHGYDVLAANDATEALALLSDPDLPIDLLLSDVVMPGTSGPDLVAQVRERWGDDAPPVLFTTGYAAAADVADERVLPKPFTERDLLRAVRVALRG